MPPFKLKVGLRRKDDADHDSPKKQSAFSKLMNKVDSVRRKTPIRPSEDRLHAGICDSSGAATSDAVFPVVSCASREHSRSSLAVAGCPSGNAKLGPSNGSYCCAGQDNTAEANSCNWTTLLPSNQRVFLRGFSTPVNPLPDKDFSLEGNGAEQLAKDVLTAEGNGVELASSEQDLQLDQLLKELFRLQNFQEEGLDALKEALLGNVDSASLVDTMRPKHPLFQDWSTNSHAAREAQKGSRSLSFVPCEVQTGSTLNLSRCGPFAAPAVQSISLLNVSKRITFAPKAAPNGRKNPFAGQAADNGSTLSLPRTSLSAAEQNNTLSNVSRRVSGAAREAEKGRAFNMSRSNSSAGQPPHDGSTLNLSRSNSLVMPAVQNSSILNTSRSVSFALQDTQNGSAFNTFRSNPFAGKAAHNGSAINLSWSSSAVPPAVQNSSILSSSRSVPFAPQEPPNGSAFNMSRCNPFAGQAAHNGSTPNSSNNGGGQWPGPRSAFQMQTNRSQPLPGGYNPAHAHSQAQHCDRMRLARQSPLTAKIPQPFSAKPPDTSGHVVPTRSMSSEASGLLLNTDPLIGKSWEQREHFLSERTWLPQLRTARSLDAVGNLLRSRLKSLDVAVQQVSTTDNQDTPSNVERAYREREQYLTQKVDSLERQLASLQQWNKALQEECAMVHGHCPEATLKVRDAQDTHEVASEQCCNATPEVVVGSSLSWGGVSELSASTSLSSPLITEDVCHAVEEPVEAGNIDLLQPHNMGASHDSAKQSAGRQTLRVANEVLARALSVKVPDSRGDNNMASARAMATRHTAPIVF